MDESRGTIESLRLRRAVWGAVVAACVGVLSSITARPLVGAFRELASWVLPVVVAGILAILVLFALLFLPRITGRA